MPLDDFTLAKLKRQQREAEQKSHAVEQEAKPAAVKQEVPPVTEKSEVASALDAAREKDLESKIIEEPSDVKKPLKQVDEESKTDTDLDIEVTPGGGTTVSASVVSVVEKKPVEHLERKVEETPKPPKKQKRQSGAQGAHLRNVPHSVVTAARAEFPSASNNVDAVAAFVASRTGIYDDLTDEQCRLAKQSNREDPLVSVNKKLQAMEEMLAKQKEAIDELQLAVTYMLFDRMGWRRQNPKGPESVDFVEPGVTQLAQRLHQQTKQVADIEHRRRGRPFR